jgi:hypothetical protein
MHAFSATDRWAEARGERLAATGYHLLRRLCKLDRERRKNLVAEDTPACVLLFTAHSKRLEVDRGRVRPVQRVGIIGHVSLSVCRRLRT